MMEVNKNNNKIFIECIYWVRIDRSTHSVLLNGHLSGFLLSYRLRYFFLFTFTQHCIFVSTNDQICTSHINIKHFCRNASHANNYFIIIIALLEINESEKNENIPDENT